MVRVDDDKVKKMTKAQLKQYMQKMKQKGYHPVILYRVVTTVTEKVKPHLAFTKIKPKDKLGSSNSKNSDNSDNSKNNNNSDKNKKKNKLEVKTNSSSTDKKNKKVTVTDVK